MSLTDGLGKLHDVPAALLRLSQLPLIMGLPVGLAHVQNFRALGEPLDGFCLEFHSGVAAIGPTV